eukprot:gene7777-biopygen9720
MTLHSHRVHDCFGQLAAGAARGKGQLPRGAFSALAVAIVALFERKILLPAAAVESPLFVVERLVATVGGRDTAVLLNFRRLCPWVWQHADETGARGQLGQREGCMRTAATD